MHRVMAHSKFRSYDDWKADEPETRGPGATSAQARALAARWQGYPIPNACTACGGTGWRFHANDGTRPGTPPACGYVAMLTCPYCNGNGGRR